MESIPGLLKRYKIRALFPILSLTPVVLFFTVSQYCILLHSCVIAPIHRPPNISSHQSYTVYKEVVKTGNYVHTTKSRTRVILFPKSIGTFHFRSNELVDYSTYDTQILCLTGATEKHV